ncbi:PfkB family carbohydrate kinase [Mucilaginibacter xinganensis]|uniref:Ribokinase n=1 Tax=Mucilaginibacter xinganensis TaxID=1234841 RepID=A0A223P141_9SPHI|nr:PfkB family carbohydrate kinase [Mucilaginibacter xinganensis]ASU35853.1 ribokinase [Mucilaginibacter xinganensis]
MIDLCCIGHITSDKVVTTTSTMHMPGGTAFYFSCAVSQLPINYLLVTALAPAEIHYVADLRAKGIEVKVQPSAHTVYFENIYAENQDERTQNVLEKADPFGVEQLENVAAKVFHLGPLLADDIDLNLIKTLASKSRVSIDVQGYLREVVNQKVRAVDWPQKKEALQYAHTVKADVAELQALTGLNDPKNGARLLAEWGVAEVVVTNGSGGSFILSGGEIYTIPAYRPKVIVDATGCGDTYMAGYLYSRIKGEGIQAAGEFAAAMASLKMEHPGPFTGTEADVRQLLKKK